MHAILVAILISLCGIAAAGTTPPTCAPTGLFIPGAQGSPMQSGWDDRGAWRGWWCLQDRYRWKADPSVVVTLSTYQWTVNPNAQINAILGAADPTAALIEAIRRFHVEPQDEAGKAAMQGLRDLGEAAMRGSRPADPVWQVFGLPTQQRPAYLLKDDGTIGDQSAIRAPVGAVCTCATMAIPSNAAAWCGWHGAPANTVSLCKPME